MEKGNWVSSAGWTGVTVVWTLLKQSMFLIVYQTEISILKVQVTALSVYLSSHLYPPGRFIVQHRV